MKNTLLKTILFFKKLNEAQYLALITSLATVFVFSQNGLEAGMLIAGFISIMVASYYTAAKPLELITDKLFANELDCFYSKGWIVRLSTSFISASVVCFLVLNKLGMLTPPAF